MKKLLLSYGIAILLCYVSAFSSVQTTLDAGELAVIGFASDNPDNFHLVLLTDIEAGTKIRFTDSGVKSDGSFRGNEGAVVHTAPETLTAGTIIGYIPNSADFSPDNRGIQYRRDNDSE